ncbi:hypothetical protein UT300007_02310 [Clostridium sp. CTA-7]
MPQTKAKIVLTENIFINSIILLFSFTSKDNIIANTTINNTYIGCVMLEEEKFINTSLPKFKSVNSIFLLKSNKISPNKRTIKKIISDTISLLDLNS